MKTLLPGRAARVCRADVIAGLVALALFAVAAVVGAVAGLLGHPVHAGAAPLFAHWLPHVGPGTLPALAIAALVVWHGPAVAARLSWRRLLLAGYLAAVSWTFALALIDGWQRGLAGRLTTQFEYLSEVPGVTGIGAMLHGFSARILDGGPDPWTTHVAGHPPGALLVFVALDRIGLGGGAWAAITCVLIGSLAAVAVPVTLRALNSEQAARAALPFLAVFPGAVWIGASADGLFAGVTATALALLAIAMTRRAPAAGFAAGLLLGCAVFLSYGHVLLALTTTAIVLLAGRPRPGPLLPVVTGFAVVVAAFTLNGFWWLDGYHLVQQRYYQGLASHRPYAYWIWANLAALVACAGPAAAPILRRAAGSVLSRPDRPQPAVTPADRSRAVGSPEPAGLSRLAGRLAPSGRYRVGARPAAADRLRAAVTPMPAGLSRAAVWLALAGFAAILLADVSGLSKAETERIWLPFAVWLPAAAVLLPPQDHRKWLAVQAGTALLINHLVLTTW